MNERQGSDRVRETVSQHPDERLLEMLEAPAGAYTTEALEIARAELEARGGEAYVARRLREQPASPDEYVSTYPSGGEPLTRSYRGVGTTFYGKRDLEADGSYVTTKWLILAYLPIVPRGSFRVRVLSTHSGLAHKDVSYDAHEVPLNREQVVNTYIVAYGALLGGIALLWVWG